MLYLAKWDSKSFLTQEFVFFSGLFGFDFWISLGGAQARKTIFNNTLLTLSNVKKLFNFKWMNWPGFMAENDEIEIWIFIDNWN